MTVDAAITMVGVEADPATRPAIEPAPVHDEGCAPKRGRPRSAEVDEAVLAAALELLGEVGISGMSMDEVASRASVSKSTIYRRWPTKERLVLAALRSAMLPLDHVDTGELRRDLDLYLGELRGRFEDSTMNDVLPHLIEVACHDPAIRSSLDDYIRYRRRPLRSIFEHAVERGELSTDVDLDVLIDAVLGPFIYRRLLSNDPIDAGFVDRLLAIVLPDR
jgi:AcrR family transcriptional regulator